jgi:hypothetical protein
MDSQLVVRFADARLSNWTGAPLRFAHTTNPPLETHQLTVRRAFLTTGLPQRILFDHGTVFFDNIIPA